MNEFKKRLMAQSKAVIITRPDGTEIEYKSQSEASRREPIGSQSKISQMCLGRIPQSNGFKARFKVIDGPT